MNYTIKISVLKDGVTITENISEEYRSTVFTWRGWDELMEAITSVQLFIQWNARIEQRSVKPDWSLREDGTGWLMEFNNLLFPIRNKDFDNMVMFIRDARQFAEANITITSKWSMSSE